jgi:hypothetical protein
MFGRRTSPPAQQSGGASDEPGHAHVLALLDREEQEKPLQRVQLTGRILFDLACRTVSDDKGVRMENLLALLASVGGQQCIAPLLETIAAQGKSPQDFGLMVAQGADGRSYYFGDAPNKFLVESPHSLISLAFGAAQECGAPVTMDMIHAEMKAVAAAVGTGDRFFEFDLPEQNRIDSPANWAAHFTPRFVEACDLYRVPPLQRATAFGVAIHQAITTGKEAIDPLIAARIVLGCAIRSAKIDPRVLEEKRRAA